MKAQELFFDNGRSANVWYCSECRIVAKDKEVAENCCKRSNCKYCGKIVERLHWLAHQECIEKDKITKAEKLDTWDGWVFYEDKYYTTADELIEELEDSGESVPEYIFICKTIPFPKIRIDDLLEKIGENSYDDVIDRLIGVDVLSDAINIFNEDNNDLVSYLPDETKMVRIGAPA